MSSFMKLLRLHKLMSKGVLGLTCALALGFALPATTSAQTSHPFSTNYSLQHNISPPQAQRQSRNERFDVRQIAQNNVSPSQAKAIAMNAVPNSKYLDLRIDGKGYRVWLVNNGRRIEVYVDARTGKYRIVKK